MRQPPELPILHLIWMVAAGMFGLLLLLIVCTPMEVHKRNIEGLKRELQELIGPHARFLKWNAGITAGLFVLGRICPIIGDWLEWQQLTAFGNGCTFFAYLSFLGFFWILKSKAEAQENQKIGEALFSPRIMQNNNINNLNNFGNAAIGTSGPVQQHSRIDSITLHQQIHSFMDALQAQPESALDAMRKSEVLAELNTLADQVARPPVRREESKIATALERIPKLLALVKPAVDAWNALELAIRTHFQ